MMNLKISVDLKNNAEIRKVAEDILSNGVPAVPVAANIGRNLKAVKPQQSCSNLGLAQKVKMLEVTQKFSDIRAGDLNSESRKVTAGIFCNALHNLPVAESTLGNPQAGKPQQSYSNLGLEQKVKILEVPQKFSDILEKQASDISSKPAARSSKPQPTVPNADKLLPCEKQLDLFFDKFTEVSIVQAEDPAHVFIRPVEWEEEFQKMTNNVLISGEGQEPAENVTKGMVLGTREDWFRVIVTEVVESTLEVIYIDSGINGFVNKDKAFVLPEAFYNCPPLCAKVSLAGVKASQDPLKRAKAKAVLSKMISRRYFVKKVKKIGNNIINVVMTATAEGSGDVSKQLLDKDVVEEDCDPKSVEANNKIGGYNVRLDRFVKVVMVDMINPGNFYLKTTSSYEQNFGQNYKFFQSANFQPHLKAVLMLQHEGAFRRVKVVDVKEDYQVTVQLMDIGGRVTVPTSSLGCIPKDSALRTSPPTTIWARLAGICPLEGETWYENAVDNFKLILGILEDDPVPLYAKRVHGLPGPMNVELSTEQDGSVNLANVMIEMGFAKKLSPGLKNIDRSLCWLQDLCPSPFPRPGDRVVFSDCKNDRMNVVHMQYCRDLSLLGELQAELSNLLKAGALKNVQHHPSPGEVVIARWARDRNVYRALVESTSTSAIGALFSVLRFIDFGTTEWTARGDMFLVPVSVQRYKVLSHAVELVDVPPVSMVTAEQKQGIAALFNQFNLFEYRQVEGDVPRVRLSSVPKDKTENPVNINKFFVETVLKRNNNSEIWHTVPQTMRQDVSRERNLPKRELNSSDSTEKGETKISDSASIKSASKSLSSISTTPQASGSIPPPSFKSNTSLDSELPTWICVITHLDPTDNGIFYFMLSEDLDVVEQMLDNFLPECVPSSGFKASLGTKCLWRDPDTDLVYRVAVIKEHSDDNLAVKKVDFGDVVEQAQYTDIFQTPNLELARGNSLARKARVKRFNIFDDHEAEHLLDEFNNDDKKALLGSLREQYVLKGVIQLKIIDHDGDKYNVEVIL